MGAMTKLEKEKKKTRDREATRQKLLKAAIKVFAAHGYEGATTRAIAEEAGVAEALIQRYFNGKQGLLIASMHDFAAGEKASCANLPPPAENLEQEWKNLLSHAIQHCGMNKENLSVAMAHAHFDRKVGKAMAQFMQNDRAPVLAGRLKLHLQKGRLSANTDVEALSYGLALSMLGVAYLGQVLMKLDPKTLDRIVAALAKAYSPK